MKYYLIAVLITIVSPCFANMASPIERGSKCATAFSSRDIRIKKEKLSISIDKAFKKAHFTVEYYISCDSSGKQIPLLFHAMDYDNGFLVTIDGKPVKTDTIPEKYTSLENTPFSPFSISFNNGKDDRFPLLYDLQWSDISSSFPTSDLIYFEADLKKGSHLIRVEYIANAWVDHSDWINSYSFRYSLSPAKHWKSFGSLWVELSIETDSKQVTTNLSDHHPGGWTMWNFPKLPGDYIIISYTPKVPKETQTLIDHGPLGLTFYFGIAFCLLNVLCIRVHRNYYPKHKFSPIVIIGSLVGPFLILWFYTYSYTLIDDTIGTHAGRMHGYTFFVYFLIIFLMPLYWLLLWQIDQKIKRKLNRS